MVAVRSTTVSEPTQPVKSISNESNKKSDAKISNSADDLFSLEEDAMIIDTID